MVAGVMGLEPRDHVNSPRNCRTRLEPVAASTLEGARLSGEVNGWDENNDPILFLTQTLHRVNHCRFYCLEAHC